MSSTLDRYYELLREVQRLTAMIIAVLAEEAQQDLQAINIPDVLLIDDISTASEDSMDD